MLRYQLDEDVDFFVIDPINRLAFRAEVFSPVNPGLREHIGDGFKSR
jgi:hypothetical protein